MKKVMHYYTYPENAGGPLSYIKNIVSSEYFKEFQFAVCYQMKPFSALRFSDFKRIVNEIKAFQPDILHIHGVQSEGFIGLLAGRRAKVKKILMTVHGIQIDAQDIGAFKRILFGKFIEPYTLKKSDAVYCVCAAMQNRKIIKKNAAKLLPVVYNFIPDSFIEKSPAPLAVSIPENVTVISTVGRVSIDKGMQELEHCILNDTSENTVYWIIGDGDYRQEMERKLQDQIACGKVVFRGQQQDVKPYLERTDIFFFPSHHENLSIALLEAGSQKCCCIVSDAGGNPEVVENGVSGLTFSAENPDAALEALKAVLEDAEKRKKYAESVYNRVCDAFSEKVFAEKLAYIYGTLS